MGEEVGTRKSKARRTREPEKEISSPMGVNMSEDIRAEMSQILTNLITKAQELGFELATLDDPELLDHPLIAKAREVIIELKKLFQLMKKLPR